MNADLIELAARIRRIRYSRLEDKTQSHNYNTGYLTALDDITGAIDQMKADNEARLEADYAQQKQAFVDIIKHLTVAFSEFD
ncbi:hypothetical protein [Spirosoma areae]